LATHDTAPPLTTAISFCIFFFQAADGIRDFHVTGVQTCALPIDERLAELSGLASNGQELFAVNDGGTQVEVFVLDRNCRVQRTITAGIDPYDVEDLALAPDGVLWLSDTGDNGKSRDTVAVIKVRQDGSASLHRKIGRA